MRICIEIAKSNNVFDPFILLILIICIEILIMYEFVFIPARFLDRRSKIH